MKDIILISTFGTVTTENNSRVLSIAKSLRDDFNIVCISTDFDHTKKAYKDYMPENYLGISCKYIHVPAYKSNLSFRRLFSHLMFAVRLKKFLKKMNGKPEAVYCAMPTSTSAYVAGCYCKREKIKFVIDVIDLWPDSLVPVFGFWGKVLNFFLFPWKMITTKSYKMADIILGESVKYADTAAMYNKKAIEMPIYLGIDMEYVKEQIASSKVDVVKSDDELWIAYGGSLGNSYDFKTLIKNVALLNENYKYKLFFIGDGINRKYVEDLLKKYSVNSKIIGFVQYNDYLKYLSLCDIAINIFKWDTKVIHSYKFNDYVGTGCFILNSLVGETAEMIDKYKVGLNFDFSGNDLFEKLKNVFNNWSEYSKWRNNNALLIADCLNKKNIYSRLPVLIKNNLGND